jgi:hypothetical protein
MAPPSSASPGTTAVTLRISLIEHVPTIWRRLLVPGEIKLSKLHLIFQAAMGWGNSHLHAFEIAGQQYGPPDPDGEMDDIDEETVLMADVVTEDARFFYEYDFGDSWRHEVIIESIEPAPAALKQAACLEGQRACPPEDCGGTTGYASVLEALADPENDEHEEYVEWVGEDFDAEAFDLIAVNANLQRIR